MQCGNKFTFLMQYFLCAPKMCDEDIGVIGSDGGGEIKCWPVDGTFSPLQPRNAEVFKMIHRNFLMHLREFVLFTHKEVRTSLLQGLSLNSRHDPASGL